MIEWVYIDYFRKVKGLSYKKLSLLSGLPPNACAVMKHKNRQNVSITKLQSIARTLGVTVSDIYSS